MSRARLAAAFAEVVRRQSMIVGFTDLLLAIAILFL